MQASQSNNASDLLKQDARQDSPVHRGLPSSFSSPIQAARKYLERQRGDVSENGDRVCSLRDAGTERLGVSPSSQHKSDFPARCPGGPSQTSWEQDRRLERSLYEGHSIEAGLSFDSAQAGYSEDAAAEDAAAIERAYLTDSDGTDPLYLYATPGPVATPDPEVVRGAIYRLARESQLRRESPRSPAEAVSSPGTPASSPAETAEEPVPTLNFGDVARRVWAAGVRRPFEASPEENECEAADESGLEEKTAQRYKSSLLNPLQMTSPSASKDTETAAESDTAKVPVAQDAIAEEGAALAHDACNLLSALALYSELLASPGVLGEQHSHYAGELKLLAGRSQRLIDRLHKVGAIRESQTTRTSGAVFAISAQPADQVSETVPPNPESKKLRDTQFDTAGSTGGARHSIPVRADVLPVSAKAALSPYLAEGTSRDAAADESEETTDLADLLKCWGGLLSVLAHGTLEVVIDTDAAAPIPASAEAVERILVNLVRNAGAATVDRGAIRIRVGSAGSRGMPKQSANQSGVDNAGLKAGPTIVLTVDDSGCGMTEAQVLRILGDKTGTADSPAASAEERTHRQGLGLQTVRELVAASHGSLSIQSQPGRGTRIEVCWPVLTSAAERDRSLSSVATKDSALESALEGGKAPVGPDGFSEADLRAMMLRLHRGSPHDRSPLSRRLWARTLGGVKETDSRFGVVGARSFHANADDLGQADSVHNGSAAKGAIAC